MWALTIGIAALLFLFLALVTLIMNPPEAWVRKLNGKPAAKERDGV